MVRALQPSCLVNLTSGLWVIDAFQPVAAIVDPVTGAVRSVVSWPQVPPPQVSSYRPVVFGDGDCLWLQYEVGSAVVRIDSSGVRAAGWVGPSYSEQRLSAVGPGEAWCTTPPPPPEYAPIGQGPGDFLGYGELRRVDADGHVETVVVGRGVQQLQATAGGLMVGAVSSSWTGRRWDQEQEQIHRGTRWYRLPWGEPPPAQLQEAHAVTGRYIPARVPDLMAMSSQLWNGQGPPAQTEGLDWFVERRQEAVNGPLWERMQVSALDESRTVVASWDLSDGSVLAVTPVGECVVVAVARERKNSPRGSRDRVIDVVRLDPRDGSRRDLVLGGTVDVSEYCWPLGPPPVEVDSCIEHCRRETVQRVDRLRQAGAQDLEVSAVGQWPHSMVETTMTVPARAGVRMRLRVPLFDELGRPLDLSTLRRSWRTLWTPTSCRACRMLRTATSTSELRGHALRWRRPAPRHERACARPAP